MTPELLRKYIEKGESLTVEFKGEEKKALGDQALIEAVVCMANRAGNDVGWVIIGVEDDGRITGARPRHGTYTDPLRVQALIANRTRPSITCRVSVLTIEDKEVIVIEVPRDPRPIATADGRYLRRVIGGKGKPECRPFFFHEMQSRRADLGVQDYTELVVAEARWTDLDPQEFERFRRIIRESRGLGDETLSELPDEELAKALGAVEANHEVTAIRVLGLLLFGREEALQRFLPTHEVAFQVLVGTKVEFNEFYRWPLLRLMEKILDHFETRYREEEFLIGFQRIGVPNYSRRAFREAVANALIHRDYTQLGAVHIQWREASIEISNPGGFPEGVHLGNILVVPPRPRNPLLADAFKRAGIVERTGRGVDIIFYEQLRNGRPPPSYERSTETSVVLVLHGGEANLNFIRLIIEENRVGHALGVDELLILNRLWQERQMRTADVSKLIQKPEHEARVVLERLVEAGLIEAHGIRRARTYYLSASTYRRLGAMTAYIRRRGFETIQQEQMILDYVRTYGKITRGDAARLCRLGPYQATRLLGKMVEKGKLRKHGSKRGTYYTLT